MKRQLSLLACLVLVVAFVFSLASCDAVNKLLGNEPETECTEHTYVDGKCECGATDPNYVAPHNHNYVDGKCECGADDPNYVPPHEHTYADTLTAGETTHWYAANCEANDECATAKKDEAAHDFANGDCVCGAKAPVVEPDGTMANPFALTGPGTLDVNFAGGYDPIWYVFTATETKTLSVTLGSNNACMAYGVNVNDVVYTAQYQTNVKVNLTAGTTYYVAFCSHDGDAAEYTVTAEYVVSPYERVLHAGNNTVVFSAAEVAANAASRKLVIDEAANYKFASGNLFVASVVDANGNAISKNEDYTYTLAAGEYTVNFGMLSMFGVAADTDCTLNVENPNAEEEDDEGDVTGESDFVIGDNSVTLTDEEAVAGKDFTFVAESAGTYTFSGDLLAIVSDSNGMQIGRMEVFLEAGTYTVTLVNIEEVGGNFTLTIAYTAPAGSDEGTESNPIVIETLPTTLTHTGEFDLYYTYTATTDCAVNINYSAGYCILTINGDSANGEVAYLAAGDVLVLNVFAYGEAEEEFNFELTLGEYAEEGSFGRPNVFYAGDSFTCEYPGGNDPENFVWYKANIYDFGYFVVNFTNRVNAFYGFDSENLVQITDATTKIEVSAGDALYIAIQSYGLNEETINFTTEWEWAPGASDNPYIAIDGDNTAAIPSGAHEVYFNYVLTSSGKVTLTFNDIIVEYYSDVTYWWEPAVSGEAISAKGSEFAFRVVGWAEGATELSFNVAFDGTAAEIEGELVKTETIATPSDTSGWGTNSSEYTYTAPSAGNYIISVTGKDSSTYFQVYNSAEDNWPRYNDFPIAITLEEGEILKFRLRGYGTDAAGVEVTVDIYYVSAIEDGGDDEEDGDEVVSETGSFTVTMPNSGYTMYTFTAGAAGAYTFTAPSNIDLLEADGEWPGYDAITTLLLEAGEEYVICVATMDTTVTEVTVEWTFVKAVESLEDSLAGVYEQAIGVYGIMFFKNSDTGVYYMNVWNGIWDLYYTYTAIPNADGTVSIDPTFAADYWANSTNIDVDGIADKIFIATPAGDSWTFSIEGVIEEEDTLAGEGINSNPYIIEETCDVVASVTVSDDMPIDIYYAYVNDTESEVTVTVVFDGANYFVRYGTFNFMLLDKALNPNMGGVLEVTLAAGQTLFMTVSTFDGQADDVSFSVVVEESASEDIPGVSETPMVIGNNAVEQADVTYAYTATESGTLTLSAGAAIMGMVSMKYTVNGGDAQILELSNSVDLALEAGDKVVVIIEAEGYSSLTAKFSGAAPVVVDLGMGSNQIEQEDVTYVYTAAEAGTLQLSAGAAIMGMVSMKYTVNDGDAQILELSNSVELVLAAGDEVVITVEAEGYSSLTANFVAATGDEGGDNEDEGSGSAEAVTLTFVVPEVTSMFANSAEQSVEITASGDYIIDATGYDVIANTRLQYYDASTDTWVTIARALGHESHQIPFTLAGLTAGTTIRLRLQSWNAADFGNTIVVTVTPA